MKTAVLIVAAGRGTRAGGDLPKQWQPLGGKRVADWTVAAFAHHPGISRVVLVVNPADMSHAGDYAGITLVHGGATRAESVRAGLEALADHPPDAVLVHDVARPLVSAHVISAVIDALQHSPGAAPALPVTDALWRVEDRHVSETVSREGLWRAQTPQGFRFAPFLAAHRSHAGGAADDVEVAHAGGLAVAVVPGEERNIKITGPEDFARAERLLRG